MGQFTDDRHPSDDWLLMRWRRYGDAEARETVVARLLPMARRIARSYAHGSSVEDVTQAAALGLHKAVDRFDPARGRSVRTYAAAMMAGEARRWLRDNAWAVRVPRGLQESALQVRDTGERLTGRLGRSPTVQEVAEATHMTLDDVLEARLAMRAQDSVSLDAPRPAGESDQARRLHDVLGGEDPALDGGLQRAMLARAMSILPPADRLLLRLRYEDDLTQTEIASRLGITQMTVSRRLRRVLPRLGALVGTS
jgi:RNA polymerase sigma-B factor